MKGLSMPVDTRQLSFWHDSLPGPLAPRAPLRGETRADVAIVGAGYTGLWTAWYLLCHEPGLRVVLLEAETAGYGASGRNGGWCSAYLSGIDRWLDDPAQREAAIRLQRLMFATVRDIGEVCAQAGIDCHYERAGALEYAVNEAQHVRLRAELEYLQGLGFGDGDFRWLDETEAQSTLNVDGARAAIHMPHCAAIHPARLARGLADRLEQSGAVIHEHSPVTGFEPGTVQTEGGRVGADTVILATEGYGTALRGQRRRLIPVHSLMVATETLPRDLLRDLHFDRRYCFGNLDHIVTYGQRTADDRIAFGCRGEYFYGSGIRQRFDAGEPVFDLVRQTLQRFFPALAGVRFTHAWGGALGIARSLRPAICFNANDRIGRAGGYFGNGVGASHLAGRTLADLVLERDSERRRTPWVNPPEAARRWEPEPLRWLGFSVTRSLKERADRREYGGRRAGWAGTLIDRISTS